MIDKGSDSDYYWQINTGRDNYIDTNTNVIFCPNEQNSLQLIADRNGSIASREIEIPNKQTDNIRFPNAFTPNGDSTNETFRPISYTDCPFVDYRLQIFNRWGELVYESTDFFKGWDGRMKDGQPAASDTYIYKALFTAEIQGEIVSLPKQGEVQLIR